MTGVVVVLIAVVGGIIQTVIGFGGSVFMMLFLPYLFGMVQGAAISSAIALGLSATLAWKFRRHLEWKVCLLPTILYLLASILVLNYIQKIDSGILTPAFGVFLILLALYFSFFAGKVTLKANWKTASVCALISGACSGLFGIGGPTMALYLVSATHDKETYIADTQFIFAVTSVVNLIVRINKGIYTMDVVPMTLLGLAAITVGKIIGLKIFNRINTNLMKKLVYGFVAISGVITVLKSIL